MSSESYDCSASWWASRGTAHLQLLRGFRDACRLAGALDDRQTRELCEHEISRIKHRVRTLFYDSAQHRYRDEPANNGTRQTSWHVNAHAVLAGMLGEKEARALLTRLSQTA